MKAHSRHTGARRSSFGRGFYQRNPLVLAAAAALAVASLFIFQSFLVGGGITAVPQGRLLRITNDDYIHVSYRVARLKKDPPSGAVVYLFGGSGAMEMIVGERSLAASMRRAGGGEVSVVSLAAHQQSFAQTLAIVDNLPPGPAVLAVGLAPIRFTTAPSADARLLSGRPLLLRSPRLEQLAGGLYGEGAPVGGVLPGFFDYTGAYLRARSQDGVFWGVRIPYAHHYYPAGATGASPLAKRRNVREVIARDRELYAENGAYNLVVLEELLRLARDRGYVVALFDQPLNSFAADPDWGGVVPGYQERVRALAKEYGIAYMHVEQTVCLRDADFADLYHLLDTGRAKWQPEFARDLTVVVRSLGGA